MKNTAPKPKPSSQSIRSLASSLPASVWVVLVGMFINRFGTFVIPFLGLHLRKSGYSEAEAGIALAFYGSGHFASSIIGGYMADALGRRRSIVISMALGAIAIWTLSSVTHIALISLCACMAGLTAEMYRPSASALITDEVLEEQRVTVFAMLRFCINLGWCLGPATGGWLASHSFIWLFRLDAITCVAFGLLAWKWLPRSEKVHVAMKSITDIPRGLVDQFRINMKHPGFRRLIFANVLVAFCFIQWISTLGIAMEQAGLPASFYGIVLGLNGVMIVLMEIPLSTWTRRHNPVWVMSCGYALIGLSACLLALPKSMPLFLIGMAVFTIGEMISLPVCMAYVSKISEPSQRGRFMGMNGVSWSFSFAVGPSIGIMVCNQFPNGFWADVGILGLLSGYILIAPQAKRVGEKAPVSKCGVTP